MKKILIIEAHPYAESFCSAIAQKYKNGSLTSGNEIKEIIIRDLNFNPNLQNGYRKRTDLEPDLRDAWEKIKWCDHMVWIHPVWWGGLPAIAKGFLDRLFLPGMAFQPRGDSVWWDKLLKGKTAHILTTLDQPSWYYSLSFGKPSINQLKKSTLEFCGVKPVRVNYFGPVKGSSQNIREKWLAKVERIGAKVV
jgi:putative NADPH-quinone reductase